MIFFHALRAFGLIFFASNFSIGATYAASAGNELTTVINDWLADLPHGAPVIAIAESAHGVAGFESTKYAMARALIERRGVRTIGLERSVMGTEAVSRWLDGCRTRISAPVMDGLWNTKDEYKFMEWVCEYNSKHPADPVLINGVDLWGTEWVGFERAISAVADLRGDIQTKLLQNFERIKVSCPIINARSAEEMNKSLTEWRLYLKFLSPKIDDCFSVLNESLKLLEKEAEYPKYSKSNRSEIYWALLGLSNALGWIEMYHVTARSELDAWAARDKTMARSFQYLRLWSGKEKPALLLAHTSHTSHDRDDSTWWTIGAVKSGVYFFEKMFQIPVLSYALTGYEIGTYLKPKNINSLDKYLWDRGDRLTYVPLHAEFLKTYPYWWIFLENKDDDSHFSNGILLDLPNHFDGFIFIGQSGLCEEGPTSTALGNTFHEFHL